MIKWTVKDALKHLHELRDPFENMAQKPKLPDMVEIARNLSKKPIGG